MRVSTIVWLAAGLAVLAPGCTRIKATQGYIVDESLIGSIQPGVDNRTSVERTLGRPTFAAQFDAHEWYYISRNTGQYAFTTPKVTAQSILTVVFDDKGVVTKVERHGMEQIAQVKPEKETTPTLGRQTTLFDDIFGNIGSFGGVAGQGQGGTGRDGPR
jgi:outer membrane protein assembly factor BamE (lipoprotein component of BamABCDE complex)